MIHRTPTPIGLRLREARKLVVLSARELDSLAGTTPGHASLIESGVVANVTIETAKGLARVLGMSLDWFVNGVGSPPSAAAVQFAVDEARALKSNESGEHVALPSTRTA